MSGDQFDVFSAGTEKTRVHPLAMEAMREIGIDIRGHRSKTLDEFNAQQFDYVITVCDRANETCPVFPSDTERIHWSFDDPSAATGTDEQRLRAFRNVRDGIQQRLRMFQIVSACRSWVATVFGRGFNSRRLHQRQHL
jgi:arsenate reductase (thioredoxin)